MTDADGGRFGDGNGAAVVHGGYSEAVVGPVREARLVELRQSAGWLDRPEFAGAVAHLASVEAKLALVSAFIDEHGPLDDDGEPRPACALFDRLTSRAIKLRSRLGLDPKAWAELASAFDRTSQSEYESTVAEGRRIRLASTS